MNYQELTQAALSDEWAAKYKATVDARNLEILAERQKALDARPGIRVGDFILDGDKVLRAAHHWGDDVQPNYPPIGGEGSFYLSEGSCSYSGSLDDAIPVERFEDTGEVREGSCWFFSENHARAHNGYHTKAMFRVWRLRPVAE